MNWKDEAVSELKLYPERLEALSDEANPAEADILRRLTVITDRGLECIGEQAGELLKETYIIGIKPKELCRRLDITPYELHRRTDEALSSFTIALYGVIEI